MSNKNRKSVGIVYSTNPDYETENSERFESITPIPSKQNLLVRLSTQGRGGKKASVIQRFIGSDDELEHLAQLIKKQCGTGGAVKNGEIVIQGDLCQKIVDFLLSKGYRAKKG